MVLNRVRKLVGHPGEIVNKAHLYNKLMETTDPSSAGQTDLANLGQVLEIDEGPTEGDIETPTPAQNP